MRSKLIALGIGAGLSLASGLAHADVDKRSYGDDWSTYVFKDEILNSGVSFPSGANIRVRPRAPRATLIRPRTHFVPEMLKSVESM